MTPRATFYPKLETNFTDFHTVDLRFCPTYKIASWSPKRHMFRDKNEITKINKFSILSAKIFVTDILQFIREPTKWDSCQSQTKSSNLTLANKLIHQIKFSHLQTKYQCHQCITNLSTLLMVSLCVTRFHCLSHGLTVGSSFLMVLQILSGCSLKLTITYEKKTRQPSNSMRQHNPLSKNIVALSSAYKK